MTEIDFERKSRKRPMTAKFGGECPFCGGFYEQGDPIGRFDPPIEVAVFYSDFGRRAEEVSHYNKVSWGHASCANEHNNKEDDQ